MNADSSRQSPPFNRLLNLASIGLLALMIFGLARLGFGVVPVWILAVPFVLLASLDIESCFSRARTFSARLMPVAFHFVIIATVFAAHQQIGAAGAGMRDSGNGIQDARVMASKSGAWGCAAGGGCGSSGGGCGAGGCGGSGGSAAGGAKSACGCGGGKETASSNHATGSPNATVTKRSQPNRSTIPLPVSRASAPGIPGVTNMPLPGNAVGPKLGAGLVPTAEAARNEPSPRSTAESGGNRPRAGSMAEAPKAPVAIPAIPPAAPLRPSSPSPLIEAPKVPPAPASVPVQPAALPATGVAAKSTAPSPPPTTGAP